MRCSNRNSGIFLQNMTIMQKVDVQGSLLSDQGCFDMWHDYMNLSRLLERMYCGREEDPTEGPKKEPAAASWSYIETSSLGKKSRSPTGTSSASSLSDSSSSSRTSSSDYCRFCKQNGESSRVYRSHKLKSDDLKITCPILRDYTCPICAASGDYAHTRRYCPQAQRQEAARMLPGSRSW